MDDQTILLILAILGAAALLVLYWRHQARKKAFGARYKKVREGREQQGNGR